MRITKIFVEGLFGLFDHEIRLNLDDRITIIHAPNGYGKTVILKMLHGLFSGQYSELRTIPYKTFQVECGKDLQLKIDKGTTDEVLSPLDGKVNTYLIESQRLLDFSSRFNDKPSSSISALDIYLNAARTNKRDPLWGAILESSSKGRARSSVMPVPTVEAYAADLVEHIRDCTAQYASAAQSLDRSFPMRILDQRNPHQLTDDELQTKLKDLELHRQSLVDNGLLEKDNEQNFQFHQDGLDQSTRNILALYIEDTEAKLSSFGDLATKLELFRRIINSKFRYKEMTIDRERGFVFTLRYPHALRAEETVLAPSDLSSGEQHELILLYDLLFRVQKNTLVLIDEPEISLHLGWQVNFLSDLQEIAKLADLDILIATHSPSLIHDRWDLTVELKGAL
jgi:ABC-type lipoprotein export system ATPase subunit